MIERCGWSEARPALAETLEPGAAEIEAEVQAGKAQPYRLHGGALYMLTRLEACGIGYELVIIAAKGRDMTRAIGEIMRRAKMQGIDSIRFHTQKPAFGRLAERYGFRQVPGRDDAAERIYRTVL